MRAPTKSYGGNKVEKSTFIGTGKNPDGPDIPLGLGMQLAQSPKAMAAFGRMTNAQKSGLIRQIQGAPTGEVAKARVAGAISLLEQGETMF